MSWSGGCVVDRGCGGIGRGGHGGRGIGRGIGHGGHRVGLGGLGVGRGDRGVLPLEAGMCKVACELGSTLPWMAGPALLPC